MPWPSRDQESDPSSIFSLETLMGRVYRGSLKAAADKCRNKYNSIKQILRGRLIHNDHLFSLLGYSTLTFEISFLIHQVLLDHHSKAWRGLKEL